jgi:AAA domain
MPRYYLTQVSIEGFRGINNDGDPLVIKFKPNAVNSIHAHNGVGKTSIFEAIHFAIFGTVPRLTRLQQAEHPELYVVNRFHPGRRAQVELRFEADDSSGTVEITVTRDAAGTRTAISNSRNPDPEGFLRSLREDFVLVDYAKFAEFIDASALQRGRSFASLVGLSRYSRLRQALEGASHTQSINTDFDLRRLQAEQTLREREVADSSARAIAAYAEITGQSVFDLQDIEGGCATVTSALQSLEILRPVVGTNDVRKIDISAAERLVENEEGGPTRIRHGEVVKAIADLNDLSAATGEAEERAQLLRLADDRDTAMAKVGGPMLRELYEQARTVVSDQSWPDSKQCPVCETMLTVPLSEHLRERLTQYATADAANAALEASVRKSQCLARLGPVFS